MGYKPQVGDLLEFRLIYVLNGQTCMNVFHYSVSTRTPGAGGPDVQDCANIMVTLLWDDPILGLSTFISADVNSISCTCQVVHPVRSQAAVAPAVLAPVGLGATPAAPSGVCVTVQRKGTMAGRHNQGRAYIGGIVQADISGSALVPASPTQNGFASWTPQLLTDQHVTLTGITLTFTPCLVPLPAGTPVVPLTISGWDDVIRYQRRRELRVGI